MSKKLTQGEFIEKVNSNNTNDIDISEFIYNGNNVKGKCRCNVCGNVWYTVPMSLFNGHGCPKCAIVQRARKISKSLEDFKMEAVSIHGDSYDYEYVEYINEKTKVAIKCNKCGKLFYQKPFLHLKGHGCPYCNGGVMYKQDDFLKIVRENNKHNLILDDFIYTNAITKSKCKCGDCGYEWKALPSSLTSGHGCPKCSVKKRGLNKRKPFSEFIIEYNEKFPNNKFSFIESTYKTAQDNMTIICPVHGEFSKRPNSLLNGEGCPYCNESNLERQIRGFLEKNNKKFKQHDNDFDWIGRQSLDFYLPDYNVAIECQGAQHYKKSNYYGGDKKFKKQIERDRRKFNLCNEHGIKLLYYTDFKGEIPVIYKPYTFYDKHKLLTEICKYSEEDSFDE